MFAPRKSEIPTTPLGAASPAPAAPLSSNASATAGNVSSGMPSSKGRNGNGNHSIVDECLTMKGDLESDGDILVKGKVIGNITCKLLIIDNDALVEGGITCEEVVVRGRAKGQIRAEKVRLERSADVDCEIAQKNFSAEEGARIKGSLRFLDASESIAKAA